MLDISQLSKTFADGGGLTHTALEGVDLRIGDREIVSLVGTSGCGKSTLLRLVCGLDRPTGGDIRLEGRPVTGPSPNVGMVFQEPRLMPWLSVTENVRLALLDLPRREQERRIADALEKVGLADFASALPRQLSGGMAQRVAIARALVRQPSVLLLDEPFSALDSFTRLKLQDHLVELWEREGFTLILVTHDVEEAVVLSDRVVVLRGHPGRIHRSVEVDLPRPRSRTAIEVQRLKEEIIASLDLS
ncbi:ABC transporter ATP-binding protein [Aquibaculum sediminis]|uniref:ABC transporter ATP-binding protein n=1 Tax=Aquibaculum sediminis TaxID=3231907 RepID=UPI0034571052